MQRNRTRLDILSASLPRDLFLREELIMGFAVSARLVILVYVLLLTSKYEVGVADKVFSVLDYGAAGDGFTDDSLAFTKMWNDACNTKEWGTTITVPGGMEYRLNPTDFVGPCKSYVHLVVSGKIIAPKEPNAWEGHDPSKWLSFKNVNGLNISGPGLFDGYGNAWWDLSCKLNPNPGCIRLPPTMLVFKSCNGVYMQNVNFKNSPTTHVTISGCSDVHLKSLTISSPARSPNTDGIHIQASHLVSVHDSIIGTGDDCISIGDHTSNINITYIKCGPGHGISIGSLGRSGKEVSVQDINVRNVNFYGSTNGARIKTWQVGKGRVSHVYFSNLNFAGVSNPIIIDQHYCNIRDGCPRTETGVHISNVHFRRAFGTSSTKVAINLNCSEVTPCTDINLDTIQLDSATGTEEPISRCNNAFGTAKGIVKPESCLR